MVRFECCWCLLHVLAICSFVQLARCDDRLAAETERLRNTPPELSSAGTASSSTSESQAQARFLPFSASFSLNAGGNNAQTFSIAGTPDGIGLSQSASHSGGLAGNGNPGSFSASQSSSIAAGLNGISASDSSALAANHPFYGPTSQATGNSFALGQASASAHGDVVNGQAASNAQSSVGSTHTHASSGAQAASGSQNYIHPRPERPGWGNVQPGYGNGNNDNYYYNSQRKPTLTISVSDDRSKFGVRPSNGWYPVPDTPTRDPWSQPNYCNHYNGWYRDPRCRGPRVTITKPGYRPGNQRPYYQNIRDPRQESTNIHLAPVSASSSAQSGAGGLAIGQSSAESNLGSQRPSSLTINQVQTSGNAHAHAQGASGSVHHENRPGNLQAGLSSGSISASSQPGGSSQGISLSMSSGGSSMSQVTGSTTGGGSVHGSATAGSVVSFPGPSSHSQIIPPEFIRSAKRPKADDPIDELITDLTDTVYDILDY